MKRPKYCQVCPDCNGKRARLWDKTVQKHLPPYDPSIHCPRCKGHGIATTKHLDAAMANATEKLR